MTFHVTQFRPGCFHVVNEHGVPIYDGKPHGKDRPIVFHDLEHATDVALEATANSTGEEE
ncbi:MAG: hypothetical protein ACOYD4_04110 [Solirubrobacterales bacterium]